LCSKQYPPRLLATSFRSRSACSSETGMPRWESRFSNGIVVACARWTACQADVSPGAPYHHFAGRSALLETLLTRG
jgi:hypothetical protein